MKDKLLTLFKLKPRTKSGIICAHVNLIRKMNKQQRPKENVGSFCVCF